MMIRTITAYGWFFVCLILSRLVDASLIICFHRIKERADSRLDRQVGVTAPQTFRNVIRCLGILGYRIVSLEELGRTLSKGSIPRSAVITFDDSFKDLYRNAYPFLKSRRVPFTLFANTMNLASGRLLWLHRLYVALDMLPSCVGETLLADPLGNKDRRGPPGDMAGRIGIACMYGKKDVLEDQTRKIAAAAGLDDQAERRVAATLYLEISELKEMLGFGMQIENHGHEHWPLYGLNRAETKAEINQSQRWIEQEFGRSPRYHCLAYGIGNRFVGDITQSLGVCGIVTTHPGLVDARTDPGSLPRICVLNDIGYLFRKLAIGLLKTLLGRFSRSGTFL